jgi:Ni/Co efflux regulator RcnB
MCNFSSLTQKATKVMAQLKISITIRVVLIALVIITAGPAIADKPTWAGGGKHEKHRQKEQHYNRDDRQGNYDDRSNFSGDRYFIDPHRTVIHDYYVNEYRTGHCPPGLAKKHDGCMPPGQAKKWVIGRPLPRDVVYYDLPPAVLINIGPPPPGYRFVRVASDILMIAIGTGMVMDAINDLGGY